ncbi:PopZ family protein [Mesorhizobium marinum]|uniref:PopZ family protein n=1 Tax=Mesorhizobium marinum TaxID=3228790 RepID=UPI0034667BBE
MAGEDRPAIFKGAADVTMAQASSVQREPSMEEILASIRRIIEDNDAGRKPANEAEPARPAVAAAERTVIEVDAFRSELRTQPAGPIEEAPRETPRQKPSLADIQAQIAAEAAAMPTRWTDLADDKPATPADPAMERKPYERSPDDIMKAIENSRAAREDARAILGIPEAANAVASAPAIRSEPAASERPVFEQHAPAAPVHTPAMHIEAPVAESAGPKPALLSERVERQVAASFSELSEAFAARSQKRFDEMAEEMIAPMLRDWMENNLPGIVERLVREEIERVARGA